MLVYWFLFLAAAAGVLAPTSLAGRQSLGLWIVAASGFAIIMGLRHEVGGDWFSYVAHFHAVGLMDFRSALLDTKDPGYYVLSWILARLGGSVYTLNLACAAILVSGTFAFARAQPRHWLALAVAVPYLLIVVGMGYTRQSAAIGLVLLGFVALGKGRTNWFIFWVLLAASFHKSAVLMIPIAALASSRNMVVTWLWVGIMAIVGGWLFVFDSVDTLWLNYVASDYSQASEGGPIRVAMNALPALLLLIFSKRLTDSEQERKLWIWISILSMVCLPLVLISPTAVDRVALYFIPLQLYVFSRLPLLASSVRARTLVVLCVLGYYASVQFVWLNFASHAFAWLPYRFMPLFGSAG